MNQLPALKTTVAKNLTDHDPPHHTRNFGLVASYMVAMRTGWIFQNRNHHHARRAGRDRWSRLVARMFADAQSVWPEHTTHARLQFRSQHPFQETHADGDDVRYERLLSGAFWDLGLDGWPIERLVATCIPEHLRGLFSPPWESTCWC